MATGDGPQAVLGVHDRPAAVPDDAQERIDLRGQRLRRGDRQLHDVALERRRVAADQARVGRVGREQAAGRWVR